MHVTLGPYSVDAPPGAISPGQTLTLRTTGFPEPTTLIDSPARLADAFDINTSQGQPLKAVVVHYDFSARPLGTGVEPILLHQTAEVGGWVPEPTTWDPATQIGSATIDHFSIGEFGDRFRYQTGAFLGQRSTAPISCTDPPNWVVGVEFPFGDNDPIRACTSPGSDADTFKIAIANNRGYTQVLRIHGAKVDFEQSVWTESVDGIVNRSLGQVGTAAADDLIFLAPTSDAILTIRRAEVPQGQLVTMDALASGTLAVATLIEQLVKRASDFDAVTFPTDVANCVMGYFATTLPSGGSGAADMAQRTSACADAASSLVAEGKKGLKKALKKLSVAIFTVEAGSRLTDAASDSTFPAHLEFETRGQSGINTQIHLTNGDLGRLTSGQRFSTTLQATGGSGPYRFGVSTAAANKGRVPSWVSLDSSGGFSANVPSDALKGPYSFYVIVTDAKNEHTAFASELVRFTVDAAGPPVTIPPPLLTNATQVSPGYVFSCALLAGTIKCWGNNSVGELGNGTTTDSPAPVTVSGISNATQISAAGYRACALLAGGTVKCWGNNLSGEVGDGTTAERHTPVTVSNVAGATQISSAFYHTCALMTGGTVKCWGANDFGQLGDGTKTNSSTPVEVSGIVGATQISAGGFHTCALLSGGEVKCWGQGGGGERADGFNADTALPVTVSGIAGATQISVGGYHACAVLAGGTVKCWGVNGAGELGDGTLNGGAQVRTVVGISTATQVVAAEYLTCAIVAGGDAKCWGNNNHGQVGDGTTTNRSSPVDVSGVPDARYIGVATFDSCAVTTGGGVKCWGSNAYGQLGDGSTADSAVPVAVRA